jgi:Fe(3+) dicitrate transport protein
MLLRENISLGAVFIALALFSVVQPCAASPELAAVLPTDPEADADDADDDGRKTAGGGTKRERRAVTANGMLLPVEGEQNVALIEMQASEAEQVIVTGSFDVNPVEYPALPEVEGTRINSGKKTSFVRPEEFPAVANNDYREVTATTPGLIVSEEPSSPIINFGYRGLDSQRSEFMQILKDGVSIKNEQFGFPETHYTPILDAVERIEFIRGGAALQFGPQPGGALNFIMKMPRRDAPFHFAEKLTFGSDQLFQNFTAFDGGVGPLGYYAYYDHREREGFRWSNSDYEVDAGSARVVWDVTSDSRFILTFDAYEEEHGEPGGLRRRGDPDGDPMVGDPGLEGAIPRYYEDDRNATSRLFDRFRLSRYYGMLDYQKMFSERTQLDLKAFGGYLSRWSKRQRGGDVGIQPDPFETGAAGTNDIQDRLDYTEGAEARLRHDYDLFNDISTFAGGLYYYHALQDRYDRRGTTPDAEDAPIRRFNTGETSNGSIFAENRFHFGRLSITPGMRLEFFGQSLDENVNITKTDVPLGHRDDFSFVPLFGIGTSYVVVEGEEVVTSVAGAKADYKETKNLKNVVTPTFTHHEPPRLEIYGNFSQAYRPRSYGELVSTAGNGVANPNLEEGDSLQGEIGLRGKPLRYLNFDMSGFWYNFKNQIGEVEIPNPAFPPEPPATLILTENVGDARYFGFEAAAEFDILAAINGGAESPWGKFNFYGNVTVIDAKFTSGPADGNTPAYAPDYQFKTGGIYRYKEAVKVGLIGTIVDEHFANAGNDYQFFIPAYNVWDLTAEVKFWNGRVGVFAGIKNLFDEDFWAEVREEGIVPAYRRNYYGGVEFFF